MPYRDSLDAEVTVLLEIAPVVGNVPAADFPGEGPGKEHEHHGNARSAFTAQTPARPPTPTISPESSPFQ